MELEFSKVMIICIFIFLGGFVDAIAGGGGLISLPAYLFTGLPVHFAYGTNKFSSTFGTFFSVMRFIKSRKIHYKSAFVSVFSALIGSTIGARLTLLLDEVALKYVLLVLLPIIAFFLISRKNFGEANRSKDIGDMKVIILSILSGFFIGMYDGFFGPGTGSFLILTYTAVIGFDLTTASGNAKIVNLASNVAALITFILGGKIVYLLGIPAAISGILGNWIGSGLAIKNGSKVIRPVFIGAISMLFLKVGYDLFF